MPLADNDTVATYGDHGERVWLYPLQSIGRFFRARAVVAWLLIALFGVAPWIDVAGHPAMRFDIPARRFYFWGLELFATDAGWLLFVAGAGLFGVFLFTALLGRAWCGWTCPQTVFLEMVVRPIEILIEGPPSQRKRLDRAPWGAAKVWKKSLKGATYLVTAGAIATTFVAYFIGRDGILAAQAQPLSHPFASAIFIATTLTLLFDFAWFREQTCIVLCPYGRLQSVLLDADSLVVGYDSARGEPRGKRADPEAGDCVDCDKCVQVCPTGVDIRKGVQLECIHCAACVDACDSVMDRLGRARGLVRYSTENALEGRPLRWLRPRVVAYAAALIAVALAFGGAVATRAPVELALLRMGGAPYALIDGGRVQNAMRLRISNRGRELRRFEVSVVAPADVSVHSPVDRIAVRPGAVGQFPLLFIGRPSGARATPLTLEVRADDGVTERLTAPFLAPTEASP